MRLAQALLDVVMNSLSSMKGRGFLDYMSDN